MREAIALGLVLLTIVICTVVLATKPEIKIKPADIVILGTVQEVTFYDRTIWVVDYIIDGYPQSVSFDDAEKPALFIAALRDVGPVRWLVE